MGHSEVKKTIRKIQNEESDWKKVSSEVRKYI